ncbi:MAG: ABC transporter permease [Pseudomonadota bacterium]
MREQPVPRLPTSARPRPAGPVRASLVFAWRGLLKVRHIPDLLFDVTVFPIMFTVIFTFLFGGAIAGSPDDYLQYLLPGIMVQTVIFITVYTGFTLNTDLTRGVMDRFRALPLWQPAVLVGALLGDAARYALGCAVVIGTGLVLGFRPGGGLFGVLGAVLLLLVFAFALSWIWTILGLRLRTPNSVMAVGMFILFPLTFASNVFVDPATMPPWLEGAVAWNPVTLLVTAVRGLMHGTATFGEVGLVLAAAALLTAVFGPLTMYLLRRTA